jgi:hypothetical protein
VGGGGRIYEAHKNPGPWETFRILPGYIPDEIVRLSSSPVQVQLRTYNNSAVYADDTRGALYSEVPSNTDLPKYKFTMSAQLVYGGGSGIPSCSNVAFRAFNGYYVSAVPFGGEETLFLGRTTIEEDALFTYRDIDLSLHASLNRRVTWEDEEEYIVSCYDELGAHVGAHVLVTNPGGITGTFTANRPFTWAFMQEYNPKTGVRTYPTIRVEAPSCYRNSVSWRVLR